MSGCLPAINKSYHYSCFTGAWQSEIQAARKSFPQNEGATGPPKNPSWSWNNGRGHAWQYLADDGSHGQFIAHNSDCQHYGHGAFCANFIDADGAKRGTAAAPWLSCWRLDWAGNSGVDSGRVRCPLLLTLAPNKHILIIPLRHNQTTEPNQ